MATLLESASTIQDSKSRLRGMSDAKLSHWIFDEVLERGWVHSSTGEQLPVIGSVTRSEAHALGSLILENGF